MQVEKQFIKMEANQQLDTSKWANNSTQQLKWSPRMKYRDLEINGKVLMRTADG